VVRGHADHLPFPSGAFRRVRLSEILGGLVDAGDKVGHRRYPGGGYKIMGILR
jgi:hypothetical protein